MLEPACRRGGLPLALHPVMTFTGRADDVDRLAGVLRVHRARGAAARGRGPRHRDGRRAGVHRRGARDLYHAALAGAANHLITLVAQAEDLLPGGQGARPGGCSRPLLSAAWTTRCPSATRALAGPVAGGADTVAAHIDRAGRGRRPRPPQVALHRHGRPPDRALATGLLKLGRRRERLLGILGGRYVEASRPGRRRGDRAADQGRPGRRAPGCPPRGPGADHGRATRGTAPCTVGRARRRTVRQRDHGSDLVNRCSSGRARPGPVPVPDPGRRPGHMRSGRVRAVFARQPPRCTPAARRKWPSVGPTVGFEAGFRPSFFGGVLTVVLSCSAWSTPRTSRGVRGEGRAAARALVDSWSPTRTSACPSRRCTDRAGPGRAGHLKPQTNRYLSAADRELALTLPRALRAGQAGPLCASPAKMPAGGAHHSAARHFLAAAPGGPARRARAGGRPTSRWSIRARSARRAPGLRRSWPRSPRAAPGLIDNVPVVLAAGQGYGKGFPRSHC